MKFRKDWLMLINFLIAENLVVQLDCDWNAIRFFQFCKDVVTHLSDFEIDMIAFNIVFAFTFCVIKVIYFFL